MEACAYCGSPFTCRYLSPELLLICELPIIHTTLVVNAICFVNGKNSAGNGSKYIIHEFLHFRYFCQIIADLPEKTGVFYSNRGLIGKSCQEVPIAIAKNTGIYAIVGVDYTGNVVLDFQRYTENRTKPVADDAFLCGKAIILLGIHGYNWLAGLGHALIRDQRRIPDPVDIKCELHNAIASGQYKHARRRRCTPRKQGRRQNRGRQEQVKTGSEDHMTPPLSTKIRYLTTNYT